MSRLVGERRPYDFPSGVPTNATTKALRETLPLPGSPDEAREQKFDEALGKEAEFPALVPLIAKSPHPSHAIKQGPY
ncbi:MAG: hypothetical protein ACE5MG_13700 [Candidatus Methylomirabilales bacterium]